MKLLNSLAFALALCFAAPQAGAAALELENRSSQEIINILVQPVAPAQEFFLRLDLLPGAADAVDNPGCTANLRADTGLELWKFRDVNLAAAAKLVFCSEHPACLLINAEGGEISHIKAEVQKLAPEKGDPPVCHLDRFRPAMPMREVCDILPGAMLHDDNGALLAGIGFAGLTWAARLVPEAGAPVNGDSLLEHLALRRPLNLSDLDKLLNTLASRGYVPWQADFPGVEILPGNVPGNRSVAEIASFAEAFLKLRSQADHGPHAKGRSCAEGSIIMAPAARLTELESSDEPPADIQIYTIYLQPCADTLLLDIAAYRRAGPA